jgi:hypothetical protein
MHTLYRALGISGLILVWVLWRTFRDLTLIEHGVEITGRVTGFGKIRSTIMTPVYYEYDFEGVHYTGAADMLRDEAAKYNAGSDIVLLLNPKKPKRAVPKEKVAIV